MLPESGGHFPSVSKAYYFSGSIDSGVKENVWHKFLLDFVEYEGCSVYLSYFASDTPYFQHHDGKVSIEDLIKSPEISLVEKLSALQPVWTESVVNPRNVLLSGAKGRYLWFMLEMVMFNKEKPVIKRLKIEFPHFNIISMLPAVYRKNQEPNSFLSRFLSVYQSFFEDMQEDVNHISRYFDSDAISGEFLPWLAGWLGIDGINRWDDEKLRYLVKNIFNMYRKKGTKEGLSEIITLYTGEPPAIMENFEILSYYEHKAYGEAYKKLYGDNLFAFYVFISEKNVSSLSDLENLKKLAELFSPAYTEPILVILSNGSGIGQHMYLGMNSSLVRAGGFVLNDLSMLGNNIRM